jgi:hypothetical protein
LPAQQKDEDKIEDEAEGEGEDLEQKVKALMELRKKQQLQKAKLLEKLAESKVCGLLCMFLKE